MTGIYLYGYWLRNVVIVFHATCNTTQGLSHVPVYCNACAVVETDSKLTPASMSVGSPAISHAALHTVATLA